MSHAGKTPTWLSELVEKLVKLLIRAIYEVRNHSATSALEGAKRSPTLAHQVRRANGLVPLVRASSLNRFLMERIPPALRLARVLEYSFHKAPYLNNESY